MSIRAMVLFAALLAVLLVPEVCWAGPPLDVSVTLEGPDEGFADDPLEYLATGSFDLDGATQTEVTNGEATVEEAYAWSYAPASCDTAPADSEEETFRFSPDYAPGEYMIMVTYTVTVRYKNGTTDEGWDSDSIQVQVLLPALSVEIIHPEAESFEVVAGAEIYFEAIAYDENHQDVSNQVTWLWDFDDEQTSDENPLLYAYETAGEYEVSVTATLGELQAGDSVVAQIDEQEEGAEGWVVKCTRAHTPPSGWWYEPVESPVCDLRYIVVTPPAGLGAEFKGVDLAYSDAKGNVLLEEYVEAQWNVKVGPDDQNLTTYSRAVAYEWHTYSYNETYTFDIVAHIELDGVGDTINLGKHPWKADNTILWSGSGVILFDPAGPPSLSNPEITWTTVHGSQSLEELAPGQKQFDMYIWIHDLTGQAILGADTWPVEHGYFIGSYDTGPGSWHWDGGGQDPFPKGVYTYRLAAKCNTDQHDYCHDYDKSARLTISVDRLAYFSTDVDAGALRVAVKYALNHDAGDVCVRYWGADLSQLGAQGCGPMAAGTHWSTLMWVSGVQFDDAGRPIGPLYCAVSACEGPTDRDLNRDRCAKWALQDGRTDLQEARLEIVEPNGDPVTDNEFAFDNATVGQCNVPATGATHGTAAEADLVWVLWPGVGGSIRTTSPDPPRGPSVTFTFTGLPDSNAGFGLRLLELTHPDVPGLDCEGVEIFFARDATNHPNQPLLGGPTPNWYYYWREGDVVRDLAPFEYSSSVQYGRFVEPSLTSDARLLVGSLACTTNDSLQELLRIGTHQSEWVGGDGEGIYCCAETCIHELTHEEIYWNSVGKLDTDGDGVSDELEDSTKVAGGYNLDKYNPETYNVYDDNEFLAYKAEQQPGPVHPDLDWSDTNGQNWGK